MSPFTRILLNKINNIHHQPETHPAYCARMPLSEKQLAANRANAAKSTGPKTPIRRDAANFDNLANAILIEGESRPQFIALLRSFHAEFLPATPTERGLVEKLGVYQWLLLRSLTLESAAITHEMQRRSEAAPDEPKLTRAIHAVRSLGDRSRHSEFSRSANRFDRQYHRTLQSLHRIRERKEQKISSPKLTQATENKGSDPETESHETH